jgi:hypothetical protein
MAVQQEQQQGPLHESNKSNNKERHTRRSSKTKQGVETMGSSSARARASSSAAAMHFLLCRKVCSMVVC